MHLQIRSYNQEKGWSEPLPELNSPQTLIIVFGAPEYRDKPEVIKELKDFYPDSKMVGCSTAGEVFGSTILDHSLVMAVIKFEHTPFEISKCEIKENENSFEVGRKVVEPLNKPDLKSIFILSDGLMVNGSQLISGINSVISPNVIVTGGLAADGDKFKKTWVICGEVMQTHCVIAVGFYKNYLHVGHGSKGGWDTFGPERRVTRSKDNILYELDNKPALSLYKEYLGDRAQGLPATGLLFPLAIRQNFEDTKVIVRTILGVDENEQSMIFAGDIPQGYLAKLMRANFDRIIQGANDAAIAAASEHTNGNNVLAIAISCVGRRLLLGEHTEEETESTLESLPSGAKQIGFYSYGEISPYTTGSCDLHNQTMTLTTFSED